jgi:hypothetical protein
MVGRIDSAKRAGRFLAWSVVVALVACGPALSEPSSQTVSGLWASTDRIFALSNIQLDITQTSDGTITGTWSSKVSPPHPNCPPDINDVATGPVRGSYTVLGVQFGLIGAGDFQGQSDNTTLSGSIVSCGAILPITFSRVTRAPGG